MDAVVAPLVQSLRALHECRDAASFAAAHAWLVHFRTQEDVALASSDVVVTRDGAAFVTVPVENVVQYPQAPHPTPCCLL